RTSQLRAQLLVRHRVIAHAECSPKMTGCERAKGEPERRRMRELAGAIRCRGEDHGAELARSSTADRQCPGAKVIQTHREKCCRPTLRDPAWFASRVARAESSRQRSRPARSAHRTNN